MTGFYKWLSEIHSNQIPKPVVLGASDYYSIFPRPDNKPDEESLNIDMDAFRRSRLIPKGSFQQEIIDQANKIRMEMIYKSLDQAFVTENLKPRYDDAENVTILKRINGEYEFDDAQLHDIMRESCFQIFKVDRLIKLGNDLEEYKGMISSPTKLWITHEGIIANIRIASAPLYGEVSIDLFDITRVECGDKDELLRTDSLKGSDLIQLWDCLKNKDSNQSYSVPFLSQHTKPIRTNTTYSGGDTHGTIRY